VTARVRRLASRPLGLFVAASTLWSFGAGAQPADEPEPAAVLRAADLVPADLIEGHGCRLDAAVANDGYLNRYRVSGRWGEFAANGLVEVVIRMHECAALEELERVSTTDVFIDAAGRVVAAPFETVGALLGKPVETVTGLPAGIGRIFESYGYQLSEVARKAGQEDAAGGKGGSEVVAGAGDAAQSYARRYLGVSAAQRRWYAKLGVDPYTSNGPLRAAVQRVARVDAAASFGLKLAMPGIPGFGAVNDVMDAVWKEDPVLIRKHNREFLRRQGLDEAAIRRFEDNAHLTPTRQVAVLQAARQLHGVAGLQHLVARAAAAQSDAEAAVLVRSIVVLASLQGQSGELAAILPGVRLPVARTRDGKLVAAADLDGLRWTGDVAAEARAFANVYAGETAVTGRELWVTQPASDRFVREAAALGWIVHVRQADPAD
jgi:hypothetical protein